MIRVSVSQVVVSRSGVTRPTVILMLDGKAFVLTPAESAAIRAQLTIAESILADGQGEAAELAVLPAVGAA